MNYLPIIFSLSLRFTPQLDIADCGPACLKMVADFFNVNISLQKARELCHTGKTGVSFGGIANAAEKIGFRSLAVKIKYDSEEGIPGLIAFPMPCIAHWNQNHFVVLYKINKESVWVADPAHGKIKLSRQHFLKCWTSDGYYGIVLGLEPLPGFISHIEPGIRKSIGWSQVLAYLGSHRRLLYHFIIGLLVGLIFQAIVPFWSQVVIDQGVLKQNVNFLVIILIAQMVLVLSQMSVQYIQNWILLHIGRRINVSMISDFLMQLMRLPLGYFDSKNIGDLIQRIQDNSRVEGFLTGNVLTIFFSLSTFLVFSVILLLFNPVIFLVFCGFSALYFLWITLFMKRRKELDYLNFRQASDNQHTLYELITGMQEIKLQGSERKRRWKWIDIQAVLFRIQGKSLALKQYQDFGALFFNRLKDIIITFIAAMAVIRGDITLGTLVSIQYIVGQLNAPFDQFIGFIRSAQDARISLDRMGEILEVSPEDPPDMKPVQSLPQQTDITFDKVSFRYNALSEYVLRDVSIHIPVGKVTAIVGVSGSGKTTLLKLLLGFYTVQEGSITVGHIPLQAMDKRFWRSKCGTVTQEGYIFSDTIANNIGESDETVSFDKLDKALRVANISDFVYGLPNSYNTMIGSKGIGVSQGQKQRLLIARAVYKDPDFLLFDEATNSLDATNERIIMDNLQRFYRHKTVVVVAHRLSTVKHADNIIVLDKGTVLEQGRHHELIARRGKYYELIQDQLDLE